MYHSKNGFMRKTLMAIIMTISLVSSVMPASAQEAKYKFDIGAGVGMSGYLGDVNESNLFKHPGVAAGLSFRYIVDTRWAVRALLNAVSLSGNSADYDIVFPTGESYEFKSWAYDLGVRGEFNFFGYGVGETYKKLRRWSPYLALGIGATMASSDGSTAFAMNIPMAFGVKYKLRERLNLGLEFSMTKVFGDQVDSKHLQDMYQIKSSMLKNTDWYSAVMFSVTYEFGERCETCHYVD